MTTIGQKIKELRKAKGMTQEDLGKALSISTQAVSKWECGTAYPDILILPAIASLFGVDIDLLFDYDAKVVDAKVTELLEKADHMTWNGKVYESIALLEEGLKQYPGNLRIMFEIVEALRWRIDKEGYSEDLATRARDLATEVLAQNKDVITECRLKNQLSIILRRGGKTEEAKELIHSMPVIWTYMLQDQMRVAAYSLEGQDRLGDPDWKHPAAIAFKTEMIQELFMACQLEGVGYYEIGDYEKAIESYDQAITIIDLFRHGKEICAESYLWAGMQTHHYCFCLEKAGILLKLNRTEEAQASILRAWEIITHAWYSEKTGKNEFDEDPKNFLKQFVKTVSEWNLESSLPTSVKEALDKYAKA